MIIPRLHSDWRQMLGFFREMESVGNRISYSWYSFKNFYFMDGMTVERKDENGTSPVKMHIPSIPDYMHMLGHTVRSVQSTAGLFKSIFRSDRISTAFAHSPTRCLTHSGKCNFKIVDAGTALMAHYRRGCQKATKRICDRYTKDPTEDRSLIRFAHKLVERTQESLKRLGWLEEEEGGT